MRTKLNDPMNDGSGIQYMSEQTVKGLDLFCNALVWASGERSLDLNRLSRQHAEETKARLEKHGWSVVECGSEKDQTYGDNDPRNVVAEEGPFFVMANRGFDMHIDHRKD